MAYYLIDEIYDLFKIQCINELNILELKLKYYKYSCFISCTPNGSLH